MCVVAAAMIGGTLVVGSPDDDVSELEAAGPPADATATQDTVPAESAAAAEPTPEAPSTTAPVERDGEMYGWGSVQPYKMRATVEFGGTNETVTPEQHDALGPQLERARAAALRIGTVAEAERLGYVKNYQRISGRGFEYIKWTNFKEYLDLDNPTLLAFPDDQPDSRIASVAYQVRGTREAGPPTDLPLGIIGWHYHKDLCEVNRTVIGSIEYDPEGNPWPDMKKRCDDMGAKPMPWLNHWMVDLWVVPGWENPWGLISSKHPDLMEEPTPWFGPQFSSDTDGLGLFCKLPDELTSAPGTPY
jgi:hypothetical protein